MGGFGKLTETEQRERTARFLYDFETECRKQVWGNPALVYDAEKDLFRWTDCRFVFSRGHAERCHHRDSRRSGAVQGLHVEQALVFGAIGGVLDCVLGQFFFDDGMHLADRPNLGLLDHQPIADLVCGSPAH